MSPMMGGTRMTMTQLSGAGEVPAVASAGTGTAETSFNKDTYLLRWTVTYSGLSGPATGGHFHGPAMPGQNAPVVVPFTGSLASPISGEKILTPSQASDLEIEFLSGVALRFGAPETAVGGRHQRQLHVDFGIDRA